MRAAVRRRTLVLAVLAVALLAGWLGVRAAQARSGLLDARAALTAAVADRDPAALGAARDRASAGVARARSAVDDPLWRAAAAVPGAGRSLAVVRDATVAAGLLVDGALPPALRALDALEGRSLLQDSRVDLDLLGALTREVEAAAGPVEQARQRTAGLADGPLPGVVSGPARELATQVDRLADGLATARSALPVLPAALGEQGPRDYFLAVQNNAEARGTGGLIGSFAVLHADGGRLSLRQIGSNLALRTAARPVVDLGPEYAERYDRLAGRTLWSSAGLTADWPSAARVVRGLWAEQSGQHVDGVIGVDVFALAAVLRVTGPVELAGHRLGGDDVADFVMRDQYVEREPREPRRARSCWPTSARCCTSGSSRAAGPGPAMLRELGAAAAGGHLQVWSGDEREQALLAAHRVGGRAARHAGGVPAGGAQQRGGQQGRLLRAPPGRLHPAGRRRGPAAHGPVEHPARGPGPVVRVRQWVGPPPGRRRARADPRARSTSTSGSGEQVRSVQVDGREVSAQIGTERGHGVASALVQVRPSRPTVVTADVTDPGGTLVYRAPALAAPDELDLAVPHVLG